MADYKWPDAQHRTLIGTRQTRVDGPVKVYRARQIHLRPESQGPARRRHPALPARPRQDRQHRHQRRRTHARRQGGPGPAGSRQGNPVGRRRDRRPRRRQRSASPKTPCAPSRCSTTSCRTSWTTPPNPKKSGKTAGPLGLDELIARLTTPGRRCIRSGRVAGCGRRSDARYFFRSNARTRQAHARKRRRREPDQSAAIRESDAARRQRCPTGKPPPDAGRSRPGLPIRRSHQRRPLRLAGDHPLLPGSRTAWSPTGPTPTTWRPRSPPKTSPAFPTSFPQALTGAGINISASNIRNQQQHVGGGFGSKFAADRWSLAAAQLSKKAGGAPVKIMLDRRAELEVAGCRPSHYARVKLAAKKDGAITAWQSRFLGHRRSAGRKHAADSVHLHGNSPTCGNSTSPSPPTSGPRAPGVRPIIRRPRSSPCAPLTIWPRASTWTPTTSS